jgi:hypothetical protein
MCIDLGNVLENLLWLGFIWSIVRGLAYLIGIFLMYQWSIKEVS